MAIQKQKVVFGGQFTADYWRMTKVVLSANGAEITLTVEASLFVSQAAANQGLPALAVKIGIATITKAQAGGDVTALAYQVIKATDAELATGVDV